MSGLIAKKKSFGKESPWYWIPTLYMAEGLPYFAVNTLTVLMYVKMGLGMAEMAFATGWLYLPWVIKPFWSPFIDLFSTKRKWILAMQLLIGICLAGIAFFLPFGNFLTPTLICFWLMAFFSATHDVAADGFYILALTSHEQAAFVGIRSTFYRIASIIGQGGLVILAGALETSTGDIPKSWAIVFLSLSIFFLLITLYHYYFLPYSDKDIKNETTDSRKIVREFFETFVSFFKKPYILSALAFMLLYRFPEALCIKVIQPFLIAPEAEGGLALTTSEVGFVNGTVGVIALLLGGIAGGLAIAKGGLKKWLWPMALSLTVPCVFYYILAIWQPGSLSVISIAIFLEQFGYGFGFSAYMLYLLYFSQGEKSTSHYAFCTAFMALGMMIPGMFAGWIFENVNLSVLSSQGDNNEFINFFLFVMIACLVTLAVCKIIHIDPEFGKKKEK